MSIDTYNYDELRNNYNYYDDDDDDDDDDNDNKEEQKEEWRVEYHDKICKQ